MSEESYLVRRDAWDRFWFLFPTAFSLWAVSAYCAFLAAYYHDLFSTVMYLFVIIPCFAIGIVFFRIRNGDFLEISGSEIVYHVLFKKNLAFSLCDIKTIDIERNYSATNGETIRDLFSRPVSDSWEYWLIVLRNGTGILIPERFENMDLLLRDFFRLHPEQKEKIMLEAEIMAGPQKRKGLRKYL